MELALGVKATDVLSLISKESEAEWAKDGVNIVNG